MLTPHGIILRNGVKILRRSIEKNIFATDRARKKLGTTALRKVGNSFNYRTRSPIIIAITLIEKFVLGCHLALSDEKVVVFHFFSHFLHSVRIFRRFAKFKNKKRTICHLLTSYLANYQIFLTRWGSVRCSFHNLNFCIISCSHAIFATILVTRSYGNFLL